MALPIATPRMLLADKDYDGDIVRDTLLFCGILSAIPPRANRAQPITCNVLRYKDRNRIATRYDKTAKSFLGFMHLAAATLWLPRLFNWP
ncbi:transposase [Roseospira marina]|nr:transposase [Roseospira marina]MBB5085431.1 transposase [Roseospira marina]